VSAGRRLLAVADVLPVTVLAVIAGAGSFTHIRDTAAEHGQGGPMSWAVAVCVDLTCVMAARERQRDKQQGVVTRRLSWPTAVLAGGILLSLAANLAQAQPTAWGRIVAAVPPAAFLVAVSMIERRAARRPRSAAARDGEASAPGRPSPVQDAGDEARDEEDEVLLALARRAAAEHQGLHGSRSPATRCAPGSASPTRPPPSCCASSAPARACRREPPGPPDPGCLPAPAVASGPRRACQLRARCARAEVPPGGRRGAARQAPRRRGNLPGTGSSAPGWPARGQHTPARSAAEPPARAKGHRPGARGGARSAELADRLSGFANLSPCRTAS